MLTALLIQGALTDNNYRMLFVLALDVLIRPWEKHIMGLKFSEVSNVHPCHLQDPIFSFSWELYGLTETCELLRIILPLKAPLVMLERSL